MGYIGMCSSKGYGFLADLVINMVWFLHSSLELAMKKPSFFNIINKTINKSSSKIMFRATAPAATVIDTVSKILVRS